MTATNQDRASKPSFLSKHLSADLVLAALMLALMCLGTGCIEEMEKAAGCVMRNGYDADIAYGCIKAAVPPPTTPPRRSPNNNGWSTPGIRATTTPPRRGSIDGNFAAPSPRRRG